jgi:hypothetical protein
MTDIKRKNGYYFHPPTETYYPSVTTIQKAASNPGGLLDWAAKKGAEGLYLYYLANAGHYENFVSYLSSPNALEEAHVWGLSGLNNGSLAARDFGSAIHSALDEYIRTGAVVESSTVPDWDKHYDIALGTLTDFWDYVGFKTLGSEGQIFNFKDMYAGRFDYIVEVDTECAQKLKTYLKGKAQPGPGVYMTDLKTGSIYMQEHKQQLAAYQKGAETHPEWRGLKYDGGLVFSLDRKAPDKVVVYAADQREINTSYEVFLHKLAIWRDSAPKWWHVQFEKNVDTFSKAM